MRNHARGGKMKKTLMILFFLSSICFAQELWNGARYGMSLDDVKKMFPNGYVPKNPSGLYNRSVIGLFKIDNFQIGTGFFEVNFYFYDYYYKQYQLKRVNLSYFDNQHAVKSVCETLERSLKIKYGKPYKHEKEIDYKLEIVDISWLSSGTDINFSCMISDTKSGNSYVLLSYHAETLEAGENL
jgi:hypothetical protein